MLITIRAPIDHLKESPSSTGPLHPFQPHGWLDFVVFSCSLAVNESLVIVNSKQVLIFKIKLQQVLSIATLLIDSTLLIISRANLNQIRSVKAKLKRRPFLGNFLLSWGRLREFTDPLSI